MLSASTLVTAYCVAGLTTEKASPQIIEKLNSGSVALPIPSIGIVLNRLNVTSVVPSNKLAEAAQEEAIRKEKGRAGERELSDTIAYIQKVMADLGCSHVEAVEFLQIERGRSQRTFWNSRYDRYHETRSQAGARCRRPERARDATGLGCISLDDLGGMLGSSSKRFESFNARSPATASEGLGRLAPSASSRLPDQGFEPSEPRLVLTAPSEGWSDEVRTDPDHFPHITYTDIITWIGY